MTPIGGCQQGLGFTGSAGTCIDMREIFLFFFNKSNLPSSSSISSILYSLKDLSDVFFIILIFPGDLLTTQRTLHQKQVLHNDEW